MTDGISRSPIAPATYTTDFTLQERLCDLVSYAVVTGRLTDGEADRLLAANRPVVAGDCHSCGDGPLYVVGYPEDRATECGACGRLHLAGAVAIRDGLPPTAAVLGQEAEPC